MPKYGEYQTMKVQKEKELAFELYKTGLSMRDVGNKMGKSHGFVFNAIQELSPSKMDNA